MKRLKKIGYTLLCSVMVSLSISLSISAQTIKEVVTQAPSNIIPWSVIADEVLKNSEQDTLQVETEYATYIRTKLTDSYIEVFTTNIGFTQIKIFPYKKSKIICVINSVCPNVCHSKIRFFTNTWQPLDTDKILPTISPKDFLSDTDASKIVQYAIELKANANEDKLEAVLHFREFLPKEVYETIAPNDKHPLYLRWKGRTFKKSTH